MNEISACYSVLYALSCCTFFIVNKLKLRKNTLPLIRRLSEKNYGIFIILFWYNFNIIPNSVSAFGRPLLSWKLVEQNKNNRTKALLMA